MSCIVTAGSLGDTKMIFSWQTKTFSMLSSAPVHGDIFLTVTVCNDCPGQVPVRAPLHLELHHLAVQGGLLE